MTDKVLDRPPTHTAAVQENLDSILYIQSRCCDRESFYAGFRRELFNKTDTALLTMFICAHCKHILREPWQMKENGTQVCKNCLSHLMTFHSEKIPMSDAFEDIGIKTKLSRIQLNCPYVDRGCTWRGQLYIVKEHLNNCGFLKIQCLNEGCKIVRLRNQIGSHQMKECLFRIVQCNHCQAKFSARSWDRHVKSECQKSIVLCPFKCEIKMERCRIQTHVDTVCPNVTIRCPFYKYGCVTEMARRDLSKHMSLPLQHVSLFTQRFESYERDIEGLSVRNDMLLDKIHELEESELGELYIQNRLLQMDNAMLKWHSELFSSLCEFDNNTKINLFFWKIQYLNEKIVRGDTVESKEFTSDQNVDYKLQFKFSSISDNGEGYIQVTVFLTNIVDYTSICFTGDACLTILNQNMDQEHYTLKIKLDNSSLDNQESPASIGVNEIQYYDFLYKEKYIQENCIIVRFKLGKFLFSPTPLTLN